MATTSTKERSGRIYYPSKVRQMEAFAINAATGREYRYKIGNHATQSLYKVVDSTGEISEDGYRLTRRDARNPHPNHLFYDDPGQFARHSGIWVDPEFIQKWIKDHREETLREETLREETLREETHREEDRHYRPE